MESIIECHDLIKTYSSGGSEVKAVNDISMSIKAGEFVMITGRNGSGKSTLLHLLALLDKPTHGEVSILGQPTSHLSESKKMDLRRNKLGYVFQEYALVSELSALENVMLPAMMNDSSKNAKEKAIKIFEKIELKDKLNRLPSELSGGEQQRVAIARALINNPKIIFADEPTANLDTVASKHVLEIFQELNKRDNITIVMVTHEQEELVFASKLIQLSDGRIK